MTHQAKLEAWVRQAENAFRIPEISEATDDVIGRATDNLEAAAKQIGRDLFIDDHVAVLMIALTAFQRLEDEHGIQLL